MSQGVEDEGFTGLGCSLRMFRELDEVLELVKSIEKNVTEGNLSTVERSLERFAKILRLYQEQPHLLDRNLDDMLLPMFSTILDPSSDINVKHETFKYMHVLFSVRGHKDVVKHLPHEVHHVEPVLQLMEAQDPLDHTTWQTRYCLLIWLSIIILIPFPLSVLDSFNEGEALPEQRSVKQRVMSLCQRYCLTVDVFKAASVLSSLFFTRSDVKDQYLEQFLNWALEIIMTDMVQSVHNYCGPQAAVAAILKHGEREDLKLPLVPQLLRAIIASNYLQNDNSLVRKYGIKIIQYVGLTFLKTRLARWRYKRGLRSLEANLAKNVTALNNVDQHNIGSLPIEDNMKDNEDDIEVPPEIESIIEELIQGLSCPDTIVRWSAAKGIGRVTARLPLDLANDVVGTVLELLSPRESDGPWHGGCLALAELARRGLLLPNRLQEVLPKVCEALVFDEVRTYSSVGSNVRDSACYVVWAFARAYDADILKYYVQSSLASSLLTVVCFDREIFCRRAASAAFQEHVGRQGAFTHGIDIIQRTDYFQVGIRTHAFLDISEFLSQWDEYRYPLMKHLLKVKIYHWDLDIRELASKALFKLTPKDPMFIASELLYILPLACSIELNERHGAILAIGEIVHALALCEKYTTNETTLAAIKNAKSSVYAACDNMIEHYNQAQTFRGMGGIIMKQAVSHLIEKCSHSDLYVTGEEPVISCWMNWLFDFLEDETESVQQRAAQALPFAFIKWYKTDNNAVQKEEVTKIDKIELTAKFYAQRLLLEEHERVRRGFAQSLGQFPSFMLEPHYRQIYIPALMACCKITPRTLKWAQSRRDSYKALTSILQTLNGKLFEGDAKPSSEFYSDLYRCLFEGINDYTVDRRGDIGAWVREAAMLGLQTLLELTVKHKQETHLPSEIVTGAMARLAQQAVEKIDRTRAHAAKIFVSLIHNEPTIPNIPFHDELKRIFPQESDEDIIWISANQTFPMFTQLLRYPPYTYHVLLGLVVSVGGLTESLVKSASSSLFAYLKAEHGDSGEIERLCDTISTLFADHQHEDRITIPMFSFLDRLISSNCIRNVMDNPDSKFALNLLGHIRFEVTSSKDLTKLLGTISLMCHFIQVKGDVSKHALKQLSIFLCNRYLYVRKTTGARLYETLMLFGDECNIPSANLQQIMSILSDTNWEAGADIVKPIRNELCDLMGVPRPTPKVKSG